MKNGFIVVDRAITEHPLFVKNMEHLGAWLWLLKEAGWKARAFDIKGLVTELQRGELVASRSFLAKSWGWSPSKVERFLARLSAEGMIATRSKIGQGAGQGARIITICNYNKYQGIKVDPGQGSGPTPDQHRTETEQSNHETKKKEEGGYAFSGKVIRLTHDDLERWADAFPKLDLQALLQSRDDWLREQPEAAQRRWFQSTSSWLAKKQSDESKAAKTGSGFSDEYWTV